MNNKFLFIVMSVTMTSCTVGEDYVKPKLFENRELEEAIGLKNDKIIAMNDLFSPYDFNDETLNKFMTKVQADSPSVKIAILKLKQARERLNISLRNDFPMFDFAGKYNFVNEGKNMGTVYDNDYYQLGVDMSWEIDIFGKNRRKAEASKAAFMSQIYNLKNVNVSLVAEVASIYVNLRQAEQQLLNAKNNLKIQEEAYALIKNQYDVSLTDEITLAQAKYLVETTRMQIPKLEYQRSMYVDALAVILGVLPTDVDKILAEGNDKNLVYDVFKYDLEKLYNLPISVVRNRPDIKMAEESLIAQNAEVGVAIAELYPDFSLSGFLGFQSLKWSDFIENDSFTHSLIPNMSFPLFHWGQLRRNVRIQKLIKEENLIALQGKIITAVTEIRNAIVAIDKEYQVNKSAREAYENMNIVSELNWTKYKLGLIDYTQVLDSEQRRLDAQTEMVKSNANLYKDLVNFYKAIGGRQIKIDREGENRDKLR